MKDELPPVDESKTPHERFLALGKRVMAVPRAKVEAQEKKWQRTRKARRKK